MPPRLRDTFPASKVPEPDAGENPSPPSNKEIEQQAERIDEREKRQLANLPPVESIPSDEQAGIEQTFELDRQEIVSPLRQDFEPREIQTIPIFESAHMGMGDAYFVQNYRYNRTFGSMDPRWPGQLRMGRAIQSIANGAWDFAPIYAVEWTDTDNIQPVIYIIVGVEMFKLQYGALTEIGADLWTNAPTSGALHDNGSGTAFLYAGFGGVATGGNTSPNIAAMGHNQALRGAPPTIKADLLYSLKGTLYRTLTPTTLTEITGNNCQVSLCPFGSDPFTASNWQAGQVVGFATTHINALSSVRGGIVAIKPEGVFGYQQSIDRWVNYAPAWERFLNLKNGIGAFSLGDILVIPMGDGGAVTFDGYNVRPFDPVSLKATPNLHTTAGSFSFTNNERGALGTTKYWMLGATPSMSKAIYAGSDLRFKFEISSSFTDKSSEVRDANLTTGADINQIGDSSDHIYIGWSRPFVGIHFATGLGALGTAVNTQARTMTMAVESAGGWQTVTHRDFTELGGDPLGQSSHNMIMTQDPVEALGWIKTTVDSVEAYWVRLTFNGQLDQVTWANCRILPWYPSIDPTNYPLDGLDRAGALPHILMATPPTAEGDPIWHDMGSLPTPDEIGAVLQCNVGGSNLNQSRQIVAIGRTNIYRIDLAMGDHPETETAPFINDYGLTEFPSIIPAPGKVVRLLKLRIHGTEFDQNLTWRFYYTWDYGKRWSQGPKFTHAPAKYSFNPTNEDRGTRFRWAIGATQSSVAARLTQPAVTRIEADFEILGDELDTVQERELAPAPPLF
jgi:hypothetical protein